MLKIICVNEKLVGLAPGDGTYLDAVLDILMQ